MSNNHLIHHLNIELKISSDKEALGAINSEIDDYKTEILNTVSAYFNSLHVAERIFLNELILELGTFQNLQALRDAINQQLEQQLLPLLQGKQTGNGKRSEASQDDGNAKNAAAYTPLQNLLHFLQTGTPKWHLAPLNFIDKPEFQENTLLLEKFIKVTPSSSLRQWMAKVPAIFWRLNFYFPSLMPVFTEQISGAGIENKRLNALVWKDFLEVFSPIQNHFSNLKWKEFFEKLFPEDPTKLIESNFIYWMIVAIQQRDISSIMAVNIENPPFKHQTFDLKKERKLIHEYFLLNNIPGEEMDKLKPSSRTIEEKFAETSQMEPEKTPMIEHFITEEKAERFLEHCGIIFLHPYLKILFEKENLIINNVFINRSAKVKALQLLYYLATFKTECIEEAELAFFKIILEIPEYTFIHFPKALTVNEKEDCRELLDSIIENWTVLKKTGPESVQNQFLKRKGIVKIAEKSLEIHLEKSGVDILLEHFPYNYGIVKLPWFQKIIITVL